MAEGYHHSYENAKAKAEGQFRLPDPPDDLAHEPFGEIVVIQKLTSKTGPPGFRRCTGLASLFRGRSGQLASIRNS